MGSLKEFWDNYKGAIIGIIVAILILITKLYNLIVAIILIFNRIFFTSNDGSLQTRLLACVHNKIVCITI